MESINFSTTWGKNVYQAGKEENYCFSGENQKNETRICNEILRWIIKQFKLSRIRFFVRIEANKFWKPTFSFDKIKLGDFDKFYVEVYTWFWELDWEKWHMNDELYRVD